MKRIKYFIVLFVMMFTCLINAKAVVYGTMEECRADVHSADLSSATGKATTRSCVQNYCNTATLNM